jgi:hypothetical protein
MQLACMRLLIKYERRIRGCQIVNPQLNFSVSGTFRTMINSINMSSDDGSQTVILEASTPMTMQDNQLHPHFLFLEKRISELETRIRVFQWTMGINPLDGEDSADSLDGRDAIASNIALEGLFLSFVSLLLWLCIG